MAPRSGKAQEIWRELGIDVEKKPPASVDAQGKNAPVRSGEESRGRVLPFPRVTPNEDAPSLEELAEQAAVYLADLRPVFDRPAVRRGLRRLVLDLHREHTSWGRALRTLAPIWAAQLGKDPIKVRDFVRAAFKVHFASVTNKLLAARKE